MPLECSVLQNADWRNVTKRSNVPTKGTPMKKKQGATKANRPQVKVQDLRPKKDAKGGTASKALTLNHNETFT